MNSTQVSSTLDRAATVFATWLLTWLASKGYITQGDVVSFLPILIAIPAAFIGWYKNRASSIVANASALPQVSSISVSTRELASAAKEADPNTNVTVKMEQPK